MEDVCQELCNKIVKHAPIAILALEPAEDVPAARWAVLSRNEAAKRLSVRKVRRRDGWESRALGQMLPWVERTPVPGLLEKAVELQREQSCRMTVCEPLWGGMKTLTVSAVPVKAGVAALLMNLDADPPGVSVADEFAAMAAHDLDAPLRLVAKSAQALEELGPEKLGAEVCEHLKMVKGGAERIQQMLEGLRAYASAGAVNPRFQKVDCHWVVSAASLIVKGGSEDPLPVITLGTLPKVFGDEIRLIQLFQNLIANGVKFHEKGVQAEVHVSAAFTGVDWQFTVEDKGIGIEPKYLSRVFEPFCRLHAAQEYPGSGLGLPICKRIVEQHGGRIWIDSIRGQGTRVHFTLPPVAEETPAMNPVHDFSREEED